MSHLQGVFFFVFFLLFSHWYRSVRNVFDKQLACCFHVGLIVTYDDN